MAPVKALCSLKCYTICLVEVDHLVIVTGMLPALIGVVVDMVEIVEKLTLVYGRSSSVIRNSRELVWCILSGLPALGLAVWPGCSASSVMVLASWLSGELSRPRAIEDEARGAPVARKGESVGVVAETLLPLEWAEGDLLSSRLPFRRRGKRDRV